MLESTFNNLPPLGSWQLTLRWKGERSDGMALPPRLAAPKLPRPAALIQNNTFHVKKDCEEYSQGCANTSCNFRQLYTTVFWKEKTILYKICADFQAFTIASQV